MLKEGKEKVSVLPYKRNKAFDMIGYDLDNWYIF